MANVRDGSFSTELGCARHVRFPPDTDRAADVAGGPGFAPIGDVGLLETKDSKVKVTNCLGMPGINACHGQAQSDPTGYW